MTQYNPWVAKCEAKTRDGWGCGREATYQNLRYGWGNLRCSQHKTQDCVPLSLRTRAEYEEKNRKAEVNRRRAEAVRQQDYVTGLLMEAIATPARPFPEVKVEPAKWSIGRVVSAGRGSVSVRVTKGNLRDAPTLTDHHIGVMARPSEVIAVFQRAAALLAEEQEAYVLFLQDALAKAEAEVQRTENLTAEAVR